MPFYELGISTGDITKIKIVCVHCWWYVRHLHQDIVSVNLTGGIERSGVSGQFSFLIFCIGLRSSRFDKTQHNTEN